MNTKKVFVVTGFELGWDNVVGVFDADVVTKDDLLNQFPKDDYYIAEHDVEHQLDAWR